MRAGRCVEKCGEEEVKKGQAENRRMQADDRRCFRKAGAAREGTGINTAIGRMICLVIDSRYIVIRV